jgi:glutamate-ammonia-ligase adenylyltransferase
MAVSQWFVRLAHAYVAALTAPGVEGHLYDVDMRLRPSGNKGPVAVSLEGFRRYHEKDAWTWERMALTRARVIAGPAALREQVRQAIAIAVAGDTSTVRQDATAMRVRMLRDLPPDGPWDVKARAGGQVEVEFVAQVLQLLHAEMSPSVLSPTTREALRKLAAAGVLPATDAEMLIRADHAWRTVQGMLRITVGRDAAETLPEASARPLLRAMDAADLPSLRADLDALAAEVRSAFVRHVGAVGAPVPRG